MIQTTSLLAVWNKGNIDLPTHDWLDDSGQAFAKIANVEDLTRLEAV